MNRNFRIPRSNFPPIDRNMRIFLFSFVEIIFSLAIKIADVLIHPNRQEDRIFIQDNLLSAPIPCMYEIAQCV